VLVVIALVVLYKEFAALGICLGYVFFGIGRHLRRKFRAPATTPPGALNSP
jgi:CDP-diacylglycerol--serine O-phosphatidyltransferase